ncbi:DUF5627 domain-containing protein [Chitinophaga japonensis]|uniref:Uncharacterized protein DUF1735 n=1 Tax=Chitinophaga japonensis TaxID=104662 RepID=A0A562ST74_CHIJA|nr:DUF5627 domain-containing protein [Chitinophaga japonensis]TWI84412.1 uncharacterized protein DUF1735 [Chitinophaga japonensis]
MKKCILIPIVLLIVFASCNKSRDFPDYEYQTVYFAYQYPVRTITLGEDIFDTQLDNQHKCRIMATTGGVYHSKKDVSVEVAVDNSLLGNGLLFGVGKDEIIAMPPHYYSLAANRIVIPEGSLAGGVEVQLADAFFADPGAIRNTYVIPLRITGVTNADSILSGKDFILYAVKYVNPWHGNYLRRGKDIVTGSVNQAIVRHQPFVENDEVNKLHTRSMSEVEFPVVFKDKDGRNINCTLLLRFDDAGKCTVSAATGNFTAQGSGAFVKKGEKKSWGNEDRDAIYLSYEVSLPDMHVASTDTLVLRDRSVTMETFTPVSK